MCPFCLASLGLVVAKTVSAGGLAAALAVKVSRKKNHTAKTIPNTNEKELGRGESRISRYPHQQRRLGTLRRLERSCRARTEPRHQSLWPVWCDPGFPAVADWFSGRHY